MPFDQSKEYQDPQSLPKRKKEGNKTSSKKKAKKTPKGSTHQTQVSASNKAASKAASPEDNVVGRWWDLFTEGPANLRVRLFVCEVKPNKVHVGFPHRPLTNELTGIDTQICLSTQSGSRFKNLLCGISEFIDDEGYEIDYNMVPNMQTGIFRRNRCLQDPWIGLFTIQAWSHTHNMILPSDK